jgi:hypothetical protein
MLILGQAIWHIRPPGCVKLAVGLHKQVVRSLISFPVVDHHGRLTTGALAGAGNLGNDGLNSRDMLSAELKAITVGYQPAFDLANPALANKALSIWQKKVVTAFASEPQKNRRRYFAAGTVGRIRACSIRGWTVVLQRSSSSSCWRFKAGLENIAPSGCQTWWMVFSQVNLASLREEMLSEAAIRIYSCGSTIVHAKH